MKKDWFQVYGRYYRIDNYNLYNKNDPELTNPVGYIVHPIKQINTPFPAHSQVVWYNSDLNISTAPKWTTVLLPEPKLKAPIIKLKI